MATTVTITETYDLKTTINKLGIIGIHTPSKNLVRNLYPGLCKNHRYLKLQKCNVTGVCASVLPADPLQVGVSEGDVAPEDMFNPILYRPVSNESFETLQNRIYGATDVNQGGQGSINKSDDTSNPFDVYYAMLAESKRWKKAMPQNGFGLRGLYPICYQMINTYGNNLPIGTRSSSSSSAVTQDSQVNVTDSSLSASPVVSSIAYSFRGKSVKMPKFPLHYAPESGVAVLQQPYGLQCGLGDFVIPKTFVAMFIIPPARLHEFYYRMRVSWTMTFSGVISSTEIGNLGCFSQASLNTYGKDFEYDNSKVTPLENEKGLVDTDNVDISKIMES